MGSCDCFDDDLEAVFEVLLLEGLRLFLFSPIGQGQTRG